MNAFRNCPRISLLAAVLAATVQLAGAGPTGNAQEILYRETFGRAALTGNQNLPNWDWQRFNAAGASSGSTTTGGGVSGDGDGGKPIDLANTESAGPNADGTFDVYAEGWQYMDGTQRLSITTEYAFEPALSAPVTFRWWQGAAYNGTANINEGRIAVRVGGAWYVSAEFFTNTPVTAGANFGSTDPVVAQGAEPKFLEFDPAAANWLTLNFNGDFDPVTDVATGSTLGDITIGVPVAAPLAGAITGFGMYRSVTGANMRFDSFTIEGKGLQAGDVDGDEDVDMDDFTAIQNHFQQSVTARLEGDLNADGMVDWVDFRQWKDNHPFPSPPAGAAVPEPAAALLALVAAVACRGLRCAPSNACRKRRL